MNAPVPTYREERRLREVTREETAWPTGQPLFCPANMFPGGHRMSSSAAREDRGPPGRGGF